MKKSNFSTPILFLLYNRPETTRWVFSEIKKLQPKKLYLAFDGPKCQKDKELINRVKLIFDEIDWPCQLKTLFRKKNLGCRQAVSGAIDWFFEHEEKGIILEDDCLPNQSFFFFIQEMLNRYKNDERIMMVSGTNYLIEYQKLDSDYFFSKHFTVWGWGTWKRAWDKYDVNIKKWPTIKKKKLLKKLIPDFYTRGYLKNAFDLVYNRQINTWDIQWVFACIFNNGLNIIPRVNLVSNIGVTGSHSHKKTESHFYQKKELDCKNLKHPLSLKPDAYFAKKISQDKIRKDFLRSLFYSKLRNSFFYKILRKND